MELKNLETNITDALGNVTVLLARDAAYLPVIINSIFFVKFT